MQTPVPDTQPSPPALEPALVRARDAARMCGVSAATWHRLRAVGRVPAPVRLGGAVLWRVGELREWVVAGCPDRRAWDAIRAAAERDGRPR